MASYYWVGGSGSWEDGSKWSASSGGSPLANPATITSIPNVIVGTGVGTAVTAPTFGTNNDGSFALTLPFNITYLGTSYSTIHIGTNGYITFNAASTVAVSPYFSGSITNPKIYIVNIGDISCQRIYFQTNGVAPNRTYWVRFEGTNGTTGTLGSPNKVYEAVFYEATPNQIDIHYGPVMTGGIAATPGVYSSTQYISSWPTTPSTSVSYSIVTTSGTISLPTNADDVFFDSLSSANSYTVTIAPSTSLNNCRNLSFDAPASGTLTFSSSASTNSMLYCHGTLIGGSGAANVTFVGVAGTTVQLRLTPVSTETETRTVNFNGATLQVGVGFGNSAFVNNVTWSLGSVVTTNQNVEIFAGILTTNNFNITCNQFIVSTPTRDKTINLGSSVVTCNANGASLQINSTGLTFNAGTSTVVLSSGGSNTPSISAATTFHNLTFNGNAIIFPSGQITATGTLSFSSEFNGTISTTTGIIANTISWWPSTPSGEGTRKYLAPQNPNTSAAITISASNLINFRNLNIEGTTGAGTAVWSGTSLGNCGNNTNISFDAPKTVYLSTTSSGPDWAGANWATSSGGGGSVANYPLPQDTAIIDNNSGPSGVSIFTNNLSAAQVGNVDMSARTLNLSINGFSLPVYGNFIGPVGNLSMNSQLQFRGTSNGTFTSSGGILNSSAASNILVFKNPGSSITLTNNIETSFNLALNSGTLNLNGNSISCISTSMSGTATRQITAGTIRITSTNTTVVTWLVTGYTASGEVMIELVGSPTTGTRAIGIASTSFANSPSLRVLGGSGSASVTLGNTNCTLRNIDFTGFSGSVGIGTGTVAVHGNITFSPTMTTVTSTATTMQLYSTSTEGTKILNTNGVSINFPLRLTWYGTGSIGSWQLGSALTCTRVQHSYGGFDLNGYNLTLNNYDSTSGTTRSINFTTSTVLFNFTSTYTTPVNITTGGNTVTKGNSNIILTNNVASVSFTFSGGGVSFPDVYYTGTGTGNLLFQGSNSFDKFVSALRSAAVIQFTAATTQTFGELRLHGVPGRIVNIQSTSTTAASFAKSGGGTVDLDYVNVSYINASAANTFYAGLNSVSVAGTNTNWVFGQYSKAPKKGNGLGFFH